jgi:diguanylate cyclase (GGDEF)-like protein
MQASSISRRLPIMAARDWAWWQLPSLLRGYVAAVVLAAFALACLAASQSTWHSWDAVKFLLLLGCGLVSVAATPRITYGQGAIVRDFLTVWILPVAILLPPVYAMVAPVPLLVLTQWRVHSGVVHRRVFSAAALGLAYGAASLTFRALPASFAGGAIGTGRHALTFTLAVAMSEIVGWVGHHSLIASAIKLSDRTARLADLEFNAEALKADFAQIDLGVLVTVVVAVNPVLAVFGVPTVLLARRFMMHAQLLAKSRVDAKTGLLNAGTWESEAVAEISRALRTRTPLSVALLDIDHFKAVNDTYGHLAGDVVLRALGAALGEQVRDYDVAGRFGGEEFVVLLPQADQSAALRIAERLRTHIGAMSVPIGGDSGSGTCVRLTVSVGVATLPATGGELTELLAAADSALYVAKQTGRNKTHVAGTVLSLAQVVPNARLAPGVLDAPGAMDLPDTSLRLPAQAGPAGASRAGLPPRWPALPGRAGR